MSTLTKEKDMEERKSNSTHRLASLKVTKLFMKLSMVTSFVMAFVVKDGNMKNVLVGTAIACAFGGLGSSMALDIEEQKIENMKSEKSVIVKDNKSNVREK